jgi:hypothetical protein
MWHCWLMIGWSISPQVYPKGFIQDWYKLLFFGELLPVKCRYKHCSEADVFQWGVKIGEENITANEWLTETIDNASRKQNNIPVFQILIRSMP